MHLPAQVAPAAHHREHRSVLAAQEKRLLVWIARRLPASVTSDTLSGLSVAAMAAAGASFAAFGHVRYAQWLVVGALAANWFGDSLDGTVARVRRCERPRYGFYVDHVIDIAGTALLLAGLACSPLMTPAVALALLCAFLLAAAESYLATHAIGVFRLSFLGVGPTELRICVALGAVVAARWPVVAVGGATWRLFDLAGVIGAAGLVVAFIVAAVRTTRALHVAEPVRR